MPKLLASNGLTSAARKVWSISIDRSIRTVPHDPLSDVNQSRQTHPEPRRDVTRRDVPRLRLELLIAGAGESRKRQGNRRKWQGKRSLREKKRSRLMSVELVNRCAELCGQERSLLDVVVIVATQRVAVAPF